MRDFGVYLYGNVVVARPDVMKHHPTARSGFVKATIRGIQDTIRDPERAIDSLMKRNPIAKREVELERLKLSIERNFVTPDVKRNGLGGVDLKRLERSIGQIGL